MSLMINPDMVTAVHLATGRFEVESGSFDLDSYEYVQPHTNPDRDGLVLHGGGNSGVCATGFAFRLPGGVVTMCGPLTAILAVETRAAP